MKKKLLLLCAVFISTFTFAQTVVYEENFDNNNDIPNWTLYDEDGDGNDWEPVQYVDSVQDPVGTPLLRSLSFDPSTQPQPSPLTPDNYAVTPAIDLSNASGTITLEWAISAAVADFADENYTVYVTDAGNSVADLNAASISFNEVVTDNGPGGLENPYTKTLDISNLAGSSSVYVAFRHHNVTNQFSIEIDDVSITAENLSSDEFALSKFEFFINNDKLSISANQSFDQINIFDLSGKQIINKELSSNDESISIDSLTNGLYLAKVQIGDQNKTFKFIK